jgi:two-component system sensor histidine kinase/response regulator
MNMARSHILVVEDHKPMLAAIQTILEEEGYTVFTAGDGVEALQVMAENKPDLIVADIMMPRMDGYTLYETVRARPEWVLIPFIFLTARSEQEAVLKGKKLGAEDYITKPFDPEILTVAVRARLMRAQNIQKATNVEFDQLKQQITTMLGHELRTPLTYVSGYTNLALEDVSSLSPDAMQEFLGGIKRGADRLTRLVEDLLLLIRLDTGQTAEEFHALVAVHQDPETIVERTVQKYEEQAAHHSLTLELSVEPNLPPTRLCEPLFVDALGRLVDNGIKFSRNKGERVTVSIRAAEKWVEVIVSDEGVGIPSDNLPHLFERFRQIGRAQMEQQGAGLGLAIAQELIHLHDGEIAVESTPEEGSTFTIRLPRLPATWDV